MPVVRSEPKPWARPAMPSAIQPIAMKIAMTKSEALGRKRQITPATIESTPSPIRTGLSQPGSLGRSG